MRALFILGLLSTTALAEISPPDRYEAYSRGFQIAKRIATLENQKNIPARAYWLSTRLIKNTKNLSLQKSGTKKAQPNSTAN